MVRRRVAVGMRLVGAVELLGVLTASAYAQSVDPADYFPLQPGTTSTYETVGGTATDTVQPGFTLIDGVPTVEIRSAREGEEPSGAFWSSNEVGVREHRQFGTEPGLGAGTVDFTPPILLLPAPTVSGGSIEGNGTFRVSFPGFPALFGSYSFTRGFTLGPMDTPAGFFCDVLVADSTETVEFLGDVDTLETTAYLVRGLGPVGVERFGLVVSRLLETSLPMPAADADCDSIPDDVDLCPFYAQTDRSADADGNGIGGECECGDQNGDGVVTIADILAINLVVFDQLQAGDLCDTNDDGLCDIADILGVNAKLFGAEAHCMRHPAP